MVVVYVPANTRKWSESTAMDTSWAGDQTGAATPLGWCERGSGMFGANVILPGNIQLCLHPSVGLVSGAWGRHVRAKKRGSASLSVKSC